MAIARRLVTTRPPAAVLGALVRARSGLRRTRARMGPVNAEIIDRTLAIVEVRAVGIAAELDLAEHVAAGRRTSAELAEAVGADADALDRLLELLATTGWFRRRKDGTWATTRLSAALRVDHPFSMRDWARFFGGPDHFRIWAAADHAVRTGRSATEEATGHEFFDFVNQVSPEAGERFNGAMLEASRYVADTIVAEVDLTGVTTVCDVGGGTGRLLADILVRQPRLRGVLFDLPEVVAGAGKVLAEAGVADRTEVVAGSFFDEGAVPAGADRYVLVSVIHDWDDERAATILRACRRALPAGGRVLVVEQVLDPTGPSLFARHTDVLMLVLTGAGRERTEAHFARLFATAGFRVDRTYRLATLHAVYQLAAT